MKYSQIRTIDISDGPGVRVGLYTQGCPFHCNGCWNQDTWSFDGGRLFDESVKEAILDAVSKEFISGLSILGGEPLVENNLDEIKELVSFIRDRYPDKTIWVWSGFLFEDLSHDQLEVVNMCDVLVDGQFIEELRDLDLEYRGSSNQRAIDIKRTLISGNIVELES